MNKSDKLIGSLVIGERILGEYFEIRTGIYKTIKGPFRGVEKCGAVTIEDEKRQYLRLSCSRRSIRRLKPNLRTLQRAVCRAAMRHVSAVSQHEELATATSDLRKYLNAKGIPHENS